MEVALSGRGLQTCKAHAARLIKLLARCIGIFHPCRLPPAYREVRHAGPAAVDVEFLIYII